MYFDDKCTWNLQWPKPKNWDKHIFGRKIQKIFTLGPKVWVISIEFLLNPFLRILRLEMTLTVIFQNGVSNCCWICVCFWDLVGNMLLGLRPFRIEQFWKPWEAAFNRDEPWSGNYACSVPRSWFFMESIQRTIIYGRPRFSQANFVFFFQFFVCDLAFHEKRMWPVQYAQCQ